MRRTAWSGDVPLDEADARRRIMDAAVRCVQRDGIDRTSVARIAAEAGVSRPTVYAYFGSRDEVVHAASIAASESFVERLVEHSRGFDTAADRLVEAMLFAVSGIRADPALAMRFSEGQLLLGPFNTEEIAFTKRCLEPVVELAPQLQDWLDEVAELSARVLISLLSRSPPEPRTEAEDRAFLFRWWPQALGLDVVRQPG